MACISSDFFWPSGRIAVPQNGSRTCQRTLDSNRPAGRLLRIPFRLLTGTTVCATSAGRHEADSVNMKKGVSQGSRRLTAVRFQPNSRSSGSSPAGRPALFASRV
ncbi:unnamed protein product [Protopolystoma xenopodis]|uniref:Uncharacterized protein n=1 Tax=Protopolystoma xenopodis TaxID=117903 RepID=A0A3S5CQN5_9PLAT|nr:unnamed protein product [Protopolystoma xenopodis]